MHKMTLLWCVIFFYSFWTNSQRCYSCIQATQIRAVEPQRPTKQSPKTCTSDCCSTFCVSELPDIRTDDFHDNSMVPFSRKCSCLIKHSLNWLSFSTHQCTIAAPNKYNDCLHWSSYLESSSASYRLVLMNSKENYLHNLHNENTMMRWIWWRPPKHTHKLIVKSPNAITSSMYCALVMAHNTQICPCNKHASTFFLSFCISSHSVKTKRAHMHTKSNIYLSPYTLICLCRQFSVFLNI